MKEISSHQKRLASGVSLQDEALIAMALEGCESAYAILLRRYQALVRSMVSRYLRDEQEIEETTQDAFLRAFRSLHGFRGDCKFSTWLTRVAISAALNSLRRQKRVHTEPVEMQVIADPSTHHSFEQNEVRQLLRQAMNRLGRKDQLIVELFYLSELSILEIQQHTGWGASDIKSRLCRARQKLRDIIENQSTYALLQRA